MKRLLIIIGCAIVWGFGFQSCEDENEKTKSDVDKVLLSLPNKDISITIEEGVVTLTGTVKTEEEKIVVENSIKSLNSVQQVVNNIRVKEPAPASEPD